MTQHLNDALENGAVEASQCRNGWMKVSFADLELADMYREDAIEKGWPVIGAGLEFGVRPR